MNGSVPQRLRHLPRVVRASRAGNVYVGKANAGRRFLVVDVQDQDVSTLEARFSQGVPRHG